ncbi:aspartyl-phosphate phosphatase Spo0E family protein [Paenibacillus athensensis]|uniref:Spo0E like sporulation regulatory protein n=2 Tax=Paenibacillus athensensis TaxID=1967502 RepID=A0A4Y8Q8C1_9BACL|nr:aspartyl-phosphate phosphatase Spo0E family protein [Paenibacillus athensensis]
MQDILNRQIEQLRGQMVLLGISHGFLHPEVQLCSRRLDQLLLQYYELTRVKPSAP